MSTKKNIQIQKWITIVSIILLIVKLVAYYYTQSVAVLSDALESIVNVIAGFIGLYSLYVAAKPKDLDHPYGHGKAEFLSSAIEGILIGLAGIFILYKAINQHFNPAEIKSLDIGFVLIALSAIVNFLLGRYAIIEGRKTNSIALESSGKHLQTDTISTVLVVAGLGAIYFTGKVWIDTLIAIALALFIIYTAYTILRKSIAGIMDEADEKLLEEMIHLLEKNRHPNWIDLHNLRVIKYGSILHIDCHLTVPWYFTVDEAHKEVDAFTKLIQQKYSKNVELFIHCDGCISEKQCKICIKENCTFRKYAFDHRIPWTLENVLKNKKHEA